MSSQLLRFGEAILAYSRGEEPAAYAGEFTRRIALAIGPGLPDGTTPQLAGEFGARWAEASQRKDLAAFGVQFDSWTSEAEMNNPAVSAFRHLCATGAIWFAGKDGLKLCGSCARPHDNQSQPGECPLCLGIISAPSLSDAEARAIFGRCHLEPDEDKGYAAWRTGACGIHPDNDFQEGAR